MHRFFSDVPYCDSFPNAKSGWLDTLREDMKAPDALGYYPPPAHLMRRPVSPSNSESLATSLNSSPENGEAESEDASASSQK